MAEEIIDTTSEVMINGIKYTVTEEMAKSIRDEKTADAENLKQHKAEIIRQRGLIEQSSVKEQKPEPPKAPEPNSDALADRLFVEPQMVFDEQLKALEKRLTEKYDLAEANKQKALSDKELLDNFYLSFFKEHPHLAQNRELVNFVLEKNYANKWSGLGQDGLIPVLEKEVSTMLLSSVQKTDSTDKDMFIVEDVTNLTPAPAAEPDPKISSLSSILREKREKRRKAS